MAKWSQLASLIARIKLLHTVEELKVCSRIHNVLNVVIEFLGNFKFFNLHYGAPYWALTYHNDALIVDP
jgi:hypothetical protein